MKEISVVEVTLDFSEGFNIQVENNQEMKAISLIQPMQSDMVAVVRAFDETWANPCKVKYLSCSLMLAVSSRRVLLLKSRDHT